MSIQSIYDDASNTYDEKYVIGYNNPYMKDEHLAAQYYAELNLKGKIVSLGCGTGQDVSILGYPAPDLFVGYDISEGMLSKARLKYPKHKFKHADCNNPISGKADILVSMFGTPNYIGIDKLIDHYQLFGASHAFFVFYNEHYNDGVIEFYYRYTREQLQEAFPAADIRPLNENYYTVSW